MCVSGASMSTWELLQLGCDVLAAGCSLVAAMGLVAFVGWLFASIAFIRAAVSTPTKSSKKHIRLVSTRKLKPSIKNL